MKKIISGASFGVAALALLLSSCDATRQMSKKDKGVAVGAAGGAVIGGIIGNNVGKKGNTALGALLGAVVGGLAGGIIGNKMDKQAEKIKSEIPGAKVERVGEGIRVTFDEANPDGSKAGVYFATNKYDITANSKLALDKMIKIFNEYPDTDLLVEGHTDDVGKDDYNLGLSQRRAEAVANYLRNTGIASERLITKWYGEAQPVTDNTSADSKALNRRVEFVITANAKMKQEAKVEAEAKQ
ncbi:MAG: OmpA family protein [Rhizobacter sp.]|nr:OmpA family protein [Ferruginibacter sp.]